MITQPKEVAALYNSLPQSALDGIQRRDSNVSLPTNGGGSA